MSRGEPLAGGALVPAKLRIRNSCGCIDFRKRRNRLPQAPGGKAFEELKACVLAFSESGYPAEREEEVLRVWAGIAHRVLDSHGTIYELEEMLLYVRQAIGEGGENGGIDSLSQRMYMLLLEEGSQIVSVEHWVQKYSSMEGRMAIDRLQGELGNDLSLTSHPELFRDIGAQCQADSFHVLRFKNPEAIKQGAEVIYSFRKQADGGACADGPWTPGPGAWLPPGGGSLVANMVLQDSRPFGYILMDAKIADAEVFESMRVRLSIIFTNVEMMRSVRRLNDDMAQEIGIRQESERKLKEALALVEEMAIKDSLTGLVNRRGFLTIAERQVSYLRRHATPYLLLYADLDGLKSINDAWGHKAGDAAIQAAAEVLRGALRDSDIVSRLGGDEFTVLVNMADPLAYDRIKRRIDEGCDAFNLKREKPWILSFSIGRYRAEPGCELSIERMLDLADADMYAQKQKKKNPSGA
jgi:diguanylate cyclase (GGDEF)-like protein